MIQFSTSLSRRWHLRQLIVFKKCASMSYKTCSCWAEYKCLLRYIYILMSLLYKIFVLKKPRHHTYFYILLTNLTYCVVDISDHVDNYLIISFENFIHVTSHSTRQIFVGIERFFHSMKNLISFKTISSESCLLPQICLT